MPYFLFSATDPHGKPITENVEAGNLSQARYKLELRGHSEIEFLSGELAADVTNMFEDSVAEKLAENPELQAAFLYDTTTIGYLKVMLKLTAIIWVPFTIWVLWSGSTWSYVAFGLFWAAFVYLSLPSILYNKITESVFMARITAARFWIGAARLFNVISIVKLPTSELDHKSACIDAMSGNLPAAMTRLAKYRNDPKVSRRLHLSHLYTVNEYGRDFDEALKYQAMTLKEGNEFPEELVDHAMMLARRKGEVTKARELISTALEKEASVLTAALVPLAQGIVEVEGGNFELAEFYLTNAERKLEPFRNVGLVGPISELKAFLAIVQRSKGKTDEADRLAAEARPFLVAHREAELLARATG